MKRHGSARHGPQQGFTLVEQVLASVIIATLSGMAMPALSQWATRNRLQTAQLDLVAALHHARGLAATTGRRTMLCPSRDGQRCLDGLHWEGGWIIGHYRAGQAEQLVGKPLLTGPSHQQITILTTVGRQRVRFQSDGSAGGSTVTFTLCQRGQTDGARSVVVSNAGRIKSSSVKPENALDCAHAG